MAEGDQVGGERPSPGAMAVELRRQEGQQQWKFLPRTMRTGQAMEVLRGEWWPGILVNSEYLPALLLDLGGVAGVLGLPSPLKRNGCFWDLLASCPSRAPGGPMPSLLGPREIKGSARLVPSGHRSIALHTWLLGHFLLLTHDFFKSQNASTTTWW